MSRPGFRALKRPGVPGRPGLASRIVPALLVGWSLALRVQAQDPFAACVGRFAQAPERWESARCFYEAGAASRDWERAARAVSEQIRTEPDRPWLGLAAAYIERERDPERGPARFREAIAAFAAQSHLEGEVRARCAFADWLYLRGESPAAEAQLAEAARKAEKVGEAGPLAEALVFQGRHLQSTGSDLQRAYSLARRAEGLLFPKGDALRQLLCLELLAGLERELGRPARAESAYRRLEALAHREGRRNLEAKAQFGLGMIWLDELDRAPRAGSRARLEAELRRALASAQEIGNPALEAGSRAALAHLLVPPEALGNLERCVAAAREREPSIAASCLLSRARVLASSDPAGASRALAEAEELARGSTDLTLRARAAYGRMLFGWTRSEGVGAEQDSLEAIRAVEALRDRQIEQMGRAGLFSRWLAPYYAASGHLLAAATSGGSGEGAVRQSPSLDRAFAITESMRARVLRDLLAAKSTPAPTVSRNRIERELEPDKALLSFQIAPRQDLYGPAGGSWLLVLTRAGTRVYPLPEALDRAPLESSVSALIGLIPNRDGSEEPLAESLGRELLGPALADLPIGVRRLTLIPDGALHLLPWGLLRTGPASPRLAERYQLSLAPSATLWERWRKGETPARRAALILADPDLPRLAARDGSVETPPPSLSAARAEGRHLHATFGPASVLRVGGEAGEGFLKRQDLAPFGLLHFAAHAIADEESPEASAVLLAADRPGEDGRLTLDEIASLDLRGRLVALSSCRSASGAVLGGEGVMSLTRAFVAAGASAVVGSLWPVRDDDARDFFVHFYEGLAEGATAGRALAAAQRQRLRDRAPAEAWAGFVLVGDDRWRVRPGAPRPRFLSLGLKIAAGLAALGLLFIGARGIVLHRRHPARTPEERS